VAENLINEPNEYRAYFTLVGDFDPTVVTASLGIQPTSYFRKGDLNQRSGRVYTFSRWNLESRLARTEATAKHIEDVLAQLSSVSQAIPDLCSKYEGWMQLVASFLNGQASVDVDAELIKKLSALELGINFDPYDLRSDGEVA
jgi:Domain of unknown function (DUF4279)